MSSFYQNCYGKRIQMIQSKITKYILKNKILCERNSEIKKMAFSGTGQGMHDVKKDYRAISSGRDSILCFPPGFFSRSV